VNFLCFQTRQTTDRMRAIKGVLLTCDSAVKQILLSMNERESFVIEDLDDFHLFIKADEEYRVRKELEAELEKNTYSLD
jgi:TFIIH basal transcription factor complex TTD-A subunit